VRSGDTPSNKEFTSAFEKGVSTLHSSDNAVGPWGVENFDYHVTRGG
jgi:hypothetical protein